MKTRLFFDSFAGLVPCKPVTAYTDVRTRAVYVSARITAPRGAYRRGEVIETFARNIVRPLSGQRCYTPALQDMIRL
jgi:hypothetical protein